MVQYDDSADSPNTCHPLISVWNDGTSRKPSTPPCSVDQPNMISSDNSSPAPSSRLHNTHVNESPTSSSASSLNLLNSLPVASSAKELDQIVLDAIQQCREDPKWGQADIFHPVAAVSSPSIVDQEKCYEGIQIRMDNGIVYIQYPLSAQHQSFLEELGNNFALDVSKGMSNPDLQGKMTETGGEGDMITNRQYDWVIRAWPSEEMKRDSIVFQIAWKNEMSISCMDLYASELVSGYRDNVDESFDTLINLKVHHISEKDNSAVCSFSIAIYDLTRRFEVESEDDHNGCLRATITEIAHFRHEDFMKHFHSAHPAKEDPAKIDVDALYQRVRALKNDEQNKALEAGVKDLGSISLAHPSTQPPCINIPIHGLLQKMGVDLSTMSVKPPCQQQPNGAIMYQFNVTKWLKRLQAAVKLVEMRRKILERQIASPTAPVAQKKRKRVQQKSTSPQPAPKKLKASHPMKTPAQGSTRTSKATQSSSQE